MHNSHSLTTPGRTGSTKATSPTGVGLSSRDEIRAAAPRLSTVVIVDGDAYHADLLRFSLSAGGCRVVVAHTGQDALRLVPEIRPDLVLLEASLPDMDGFDVLTALRVQSTVPIVMVAARAEVEDMMKGFERGADDYLAKPYHVCVLPKRVEAVMRRAAPTVEALVYRFGNAEFDPRQRAIVSGEATVKLIATESEILRLLLRYQGTALPPTYILTHVRQSAGPRSLGTVKTHIYHLRGKLARLLGHPMRIQTVPGGYTLMIGDGQGLDLVRHAS